MVEYGGRILSVAQGLGILVRRVQSLGEKWTDLGGWGTHTERLHHCTLSSKAPSS